MTLSISDAQHNNALQVVSFVMLNVTFFMMLSVAMLNVYGEYRYAECRGAFQDGNMTLSIITISIMTISIMTLGIMTLGLTM